MKCLLTSILYRQVPTLQPLQDISPQSSFLDTEWPSPKSLQDLEGSPLALQDMAGPPPFQNLRGPPHFVQAFKGHPPCLHYINGFPVLLQEVDTQLELLLIMKENDSGLSSASPNLHTHCKTLGLF